MERPRLVQRRLRVRPAAGPAGLGPPQLNGHPDAGRAPAARNAAAAAAALAGLIGVVYVLALGTAAGRSFDVRAEQVPGLEQIRPGSSAVLVFSLPWLAAAASIALLAVAVAAQAMRAGGERGIVRAAAPVAAAFLTAEAVKWLLGRLTPLAAWSEHGSSASFPSVHAAVGMSLALGLVAVAPARSRPAALALAVAYSTAVGTLALLEGWHYPSDVVAGNLLGAACALAAVSARGPDRRGGFRRLPALADGLLRSAPAVAVCAAVALAGVALVASATRFVPDWLHVGPFLAGAAAVAASAGAAVLLAARATAR